VLDNLEHLLPDAARLIARLLQDAPECRLLSTSRAPIGIDGETLVALAPLPCDDTLASPAVQLFVHRARQVAHDFRIDGREPADHRRAVPTAGRRAAGD
jgi:predicted ATPase